MTSDPATPGPVFGKERKLSVVDRFGGWLSSRRLRREAGGFAGKRIGDFGCGFQGDFVRGLLDDIASAVVVDVAIAPELQQHPKVTAIEGSLPDALVSLPDHSLDVAMCVSVLEHLWEPALSLQQFRRLLAPGGVCLLNVPSWRGKRMLELSAFRLHLSEPEMIDDHKRYYDPKDLWPMLVTAGFRPQGIRCFRHKFGLNTFAACRVP